MSDAQDIVARLESRIFTLHRYGTGSNRAAELEDDALEEIQRLRRELLAAREDARRWAIVLACVRAGTMGQWVVLEDDPHDDAKIKAQFVAAIDSAMKGDAA
jgi:hypothetical protein